MKSFSILSVATVGLLLVACGSQGQAPEETAEGALRNRNDMPIVDALVGVWVEQGEARTLLFHSVTLRSDGTYLARGGCRDGAEAGPRCHRLTVSNGTWSRGEASTQEQLISDGAEKIVLVDAADKKLEYFYKLNGSTAQVAADPAGDWSTFQKQAQGRAGPDDACGVHGEGRECISGFECRSNCPPNALCLVSLMTCQPAVQKIRAGGVCQLSPGAPACEDGTTCKDNCPPNAMCFARINTCQP